MATEVEAPIFGWRLLVVVGVTIITILATALAIRSSLSLDEPKPASLANKSFTSPAPTPVSAPGPTLEVALAPLSSGDVMVTEVLRSELSKTSLVLVAPPLPEDGPRPRVLDLQVEVGEVRVSVPTTVPEGPWNVRLPTPGTKVTLSYRLADASTQDPSAASRRALVQMRPLAYAVVPDGATAVVRVNGVVVHNLVCPDLRLAKQLCGREDFKRWETVELPANMSTVVAQVDLPAA